MSADGVSQLYIIGFSLSSPSAIGRAITLRGKRFSGTSLSTDLQTNRDKTITGKLLLSELEIESCHCGSTAYNHVFPERSNICKMTDIITNVLNKLEQIITNEYLCSSAPTIC